MRYLLRMPVAVLHVNQTGTVHWNLNQTQETLGSDLRGFQVWQQARVVDLLPVIVVNVLYMLFGVVGNSVVCYICLFRLQRTVINSFVLSLGVLELLGCMFTIPMDITQLLNVYQFDWVILCKLDRFLGKLVIFATGCVLLAIATERYKRIVQPLGRHMALRQFKLAILGALCCSALMALPEAFLAGNETIQTGSGVGVVCSTYHSDEYHNSILPKIWGLVVVVLYVASILAITVIYFLIASQIWSRAKVHTDRRSRPNTPDSTLQRRVRCSSYNPRISNELSPGKDQPRTSVNGPLKSRWQQRVRSTFINPGDIKCDNLCPLFVTKSVEDSRVFEKRSFSDSRKAKVCGLNTDTLDTRVSGNIENSKTIQNTNNKIYSQKISNNNEKNTGPIKPNSKTCEDESSCNALVHHDNDIDVDIRYKEVKYIKKEETNTHADSNNASMFFDKVIKILNDQTAAVNHSNNNNNSQCLISYNSQVLLPTTLTTTCRPLAPTTYPESGSPRESHRRRCRYSRKRTTFIMFAMSLTTVVSHLPHLVVMLFSLLRPSMVVQLSPDQSVLFHLAWNSFFISLAAHPFMYGFWNGRFKAAFTSLFSDLKRSNPRTTERDSCSSTRQF